MVNPSKIIEGGVEFSLGKLQGEQVVYEFPKILSYMEAKGKMLFGQHFRLYEEDREVLFKICNYIIGEKDNCKKFEIDLSKGILLSGPVGCGKTSLMKLVRHILPHHRPYVVMPTRNVAFAFNHIGYKVIEDYGSGSYFCFDDLGVEPLGRFFGKDCNVMGEILLSRYELFLQNGIKTHATTNLNASELEEYYGIRVRSRMRQLFNVISFDMEVKDKRK